VPGGITETWDWVRPGGWGKVVFGLAFRSVYNRASAGRKGPQGCGENPRFEREVEFARYFIAGDRETVGSIGDGRNFSAECHAERCTNLS